MKVIRLDVLVLNQDEIKSLLNMKDVINAVRKVFIAKATGKVQMPPKSYLHFEKYNGDLRVMPSYLEENDTASVKIVNSHADNPNKYNLPTVMALVTVFDPKTGAPLSVMDGTYITAIRTGAAAAVATEYLARKDSKVLGLVGAGVQAIPQLSAINEVSELSEVRAYDIDPKRRKEFVSIAETRYNLKIVNCPTIRECVEKSDIISTITPVKNPIVKDGWINEGVHINAMGADAPGKEGRDVRRGQQKAPLRDAQTNAKTSGRGTGQVKREGCSDDRMCQVWKQSGR